MLKMPPDGGTTAEVHLPASLIWPDAIPGGWLRQAGGVPLDVPFSAVRFAAGPMPPGEPETAVRETAVRETAPLSTPVPPPASAAACADQETGEAPDRARGRSGVS
jgi:hypothetical protein